MSAETRADSQPTPSPGRSLLVSNRLPVTVKIEGGAALFTDSSGGLATGLRGVHRRGGGRWVGWPGDISGITDANRPLMDAHLDELRCTPVYLSATEMAQYY